MSQNQGSLKLVWVSRQEAQSRSAEWTSFLLEVLGDGYCPTSEFNWTFSQIQEELGRGESYLGFIDERPLGFILFHNSMDESELLAFWLSPHSRRQGWARAFLDEAIKMLQCASRVTLEVHEKNIAAIKLYEKVGFVLVGHRKKYYSDQSSALLMQKTISS